LNQLTPSSNAAITPIFRTLLAIVLVVLGLVIVSLVSNGIELGLLISFIGASLFISTVLRPSAPRLEGIAARLHLTPRHLVFGLAVCWSALTVFTNNLIARQDRFDFSLTWILWGATIVSVVATFTVWPTGSIRRWVKTHRGELVGLGLITLLGIALRFYQLGQLPRVIDGDEGLHGLYALMTRRGNLSNPFSLFANIGSLYLHAINLAITMFGRTPFGLRLIPACLGSLAVPTTYLLARQLFGKRVAVFSGLLLAVAHAHLHFSRIASVPYILDTFFIPLELLFFSRALMRRSSLSAAVGGVVLAVHFSMYLTAQVVVAFLIVYLVILAVARQPLLRASWRQVVVFWSSTLIVALPQLAYAVANPDQFFSRLNADGVFQSGWLATEMVSTGRSVVQILADRVAHVFLSLIAYPSIEFYNTPLAVLDMMTAALFILGLVYALFQTRKPQYLLLNGYFWALVVSIGLFAVPPGADSYRVLSILPAAMILGALGLDQILAALQLNLPVHRLTRVGLVVSLFAGLLWFNTNAYFQDFAGRCRFGGDVGTRFASYFGNYLRDLDRETTVYLLSSDEARYGVHRSVDFLSGDKPVTNFDGAIAQLSVTPAMVVVTSPTRADELRDWAGQHPGGKLHFEYDCGRIMLLAYQLP